LKRSLWELLKDEDKNFFVCVGDVVFLSRHGNSWRELRPYAKMPLKYEEEGGSIEIVAESWGVTPREAADKVRSYFGVPKRPKVPMRPRRFMKVREDDEDTMEAWWENEMLNSVGMGTRRRPNLDDPNPGIEGIFYKLDRSETTETDAFVSDAPRAAG